ncbi:hypothetical protein ACGYKB_18415 [Sulfitobacter sp. 916]|uniref:hypothetical protein n=1 Tax=Sulfitobacter sp. 916 TaxID=3368559 RepID=UPI003744FA26
MPSTRAAKATETSSNLYDIVATALQAKDRLPGGGVSEYLPEGYKGVDFHLEERSDGWAWGLTFHGSQVQDNQSARINVPCPVVSPTKREAFLMGASVLCMALTGSAELPFLATDSKLLVTGYGTGGFTGIFSLSQPGPWL